MPIVNIETIDGWSAERSTVGDREEPIAYRIGANMPLWLIDGLQGVWDDARPEHVAVKFKQANGRDMNIADITVRVEIGRDWASHKEKLKDYLCKTLIEFLTNYGFDSYRPFVDVEVVIMDWAGASLNNYFQITNEW